MSNLILSCTCNNNEFVFKCSDYFSIDCAIEFCWTHFGVGPLEFIVKGDKEKVLLNYFFERKEDFINGDF